MSSRAYYEDGEFIPGWCEHDLEITVFNDRWTYDHHRRPAERELARRFTKNGVVDREHAINRFYKVVLAGIAQIVRAFPDRQETDYPGTICRKVATTFADHFIAEYELGNMDHHLE